MKKYLYLNSRDELLRIDIDKIVYFEADGNYTNIVLSNNLRGVVCVNLANMQKLLTEKLKEDASRFIRIGKKYIINHLYLFQISVLKQSLVLSDGAKFDYTLSVSKEALKNLKDLYAKHQ